jgi:sulfatase maturation enzyme AslB (radical SAM superfamily)
VALTACGHGSDKNRIYAAKELKQNLKHCKQLRKLYLQTEKVKKNMLQAINQIPL